MRVRKRQIETDAYRWDSQLRFKSEICNGDCGYPLQPHIHGPRGMIKLRDGDWIITGVNGCKYPIDDETFHKIYEVIE